ncbi:hypothetical protein B0H10DRAFT_2437370 [Mycena sp. CBHHK59/15]|nr:hypothetical protein B0H10DRAFT_2437370 [Mycena sp. CBHHK59/15]
MPTFPCSYCSARLPTRQGLRSHTSQSISCREKHYRLYAAAGSDFESDGEVGELEDQDSDVEMEPAGPMEIQEAEPEPDHDELMDEDETFDPPACDIEIPATGPGTPAADPGPGKHHRATVEEVEDEDDRWTQDFPEAFEAGAVLEACKTQFEKLRDEQKAAGRVPWEPFESEDEWELARWLMTSGISLKKTDEFLKLKKVRAMDPSFHNSRAFLKRVDALPEGPEWFCHPFELLGDELDADGNPKKEVLELWHRDPIECVRELLGNPAFTNQGYAPFRVFKNGNRTNREYSEMWTADWWWNIQELLPEGSTLAPIIISSDKTQLTRFSGDKQAWPVYLTIGNIDKETRRTPSARATVLLGYIPVSKLEIFSKGKRSGVNHQLFHDCMKVILEPLKVAGKDGVQMDCADGFVRKMFLILSAYIADYPEQCLVACCRENSCPRCLVTPKCRGEKDYCDFRNPDDTLKALSEQSKGEYPTEFVDQNLRPINPFWAGFPHCDIFSCMTPDILHELHNGVFGDHIVSWATAATSGTGDEIDHRFRAMSSHPSLRHFKKGTSLTSQWTGGEHKNMEKVFLGVLAGATEPAVQRAVRGIIDFIYYAHFETHCDDSLAKLDAAWATFHDNKEVFKILEIRKHFDINKLHKIKHYIDSIRSRGTADGLTLRTPSACILTSQNRQESIYRFGTYLQWAIPGYVADSKSTPDKDEDDDDGNGEDPPEEVRPVPISADDSDDEGELEELHAPQLSSPSYAVAKKPGFPNLTVTSISTDFHALTSSNSVFPVYKRLSLVLPRVSEVTSHKVQDKIRAVKGEPLKMSATGVKPATAGQFDTILARTHLRGEGQSPTDVGLLPSSYYLIKSRISIDTKDLCDMVTDDLRATDPASKDYQSYLKLPEIE